jgi:hypothetical protein
MLISGAAHRATLLRDGAEQEKAQLIGRIVSAVVVQSDALQIQISKGVLGAELLGAGKNASRVRSLYGLYGIKQKRKIGSSATVIRARLRL